MKNRTSKNILIFPPQYLGHLPDRWPWHGWYSFLHWQFYKRININVESLSHKNKKLHTWVSWGTAKPQRGTRSGFGKCELIYPSGGRGQLSSSSSVWLLLLFRTTVFYPQLEGATDFHQDWVSWCGPSALHWEGKSPTAVAAEGHTYNLNNETPFPHHKSSRVEQQCIKTKVCK